MSDLDQFRQQTRDWLDANCPQSMRTPATIDDAIWGGRNIEFKTGDQRLWFERMRDKQWFAPGWPSEYGGGGLSLEEQEILKQEMAGLKCRAPQMNLGISMVGPVLLEFGTEAQRQEHIPPITNGTIRWCQGYSEPGAGSDLAGLQCKAERDGDDYIINGSKIWTSYGHKSDWMYCLVRTDFAAPKHDGISFVLLDMASVGVSTRPITLINGNATFCQTFFDNVRVPIRDRLGEENKGWTIAKRLLQFERQLMGDNRDRNARELLSIEDAAKNYIGMDDGKLANAHYRDALAHYLMDEKAQEITLQRVMEEMGEAVPSVAGTATIAKYVATEQKKCKGELMVDMMGDQGRGWEGEGFTHPELNVTKDWLGSYTLTIAGGTSEVQLNIIAKRVLGLPD